MFTFVQIVAERGTYRFQEIISERMHDHSLFKIIFDMSFDLHQTHLRSCAGPGVAAWLFVLLVIPCFYLPSNVFSSTLSIKLNLPHPLTLGLTHYVCGEPLDPLGIHLLRCAHGGEKTTSHDVVRDAFASIVKDAGFHVLWEQTHILPLPFL
jgi:hypothetical protein